MQSSILVKITKHCVWVSIHQYRKLTQLMYVLEIYYSIKIFKHLHYIDLNNVFF